MSDELPRHRSLGSLKKEAKRWLDALRAGDAGARERLARALGAASTGPSLREVQRALAREHGFVGWAALKQAIERAYAAGRVAGAQALSRYEAAAQALLEAYRTGAPDAMEAHYAQTWHRRPWQSMRAYVQLDLGKQPSSAGEDLDITLDDACYLIAREHGFHDWQALRSFTQSASASRSVASKPVQLVRETAPDGALRTLLSTREWHVVLSALAQCPDTRLQGRGEMTDEVLADVARIEGVTALDLSGSKALTDAGILQLVKLPQLEYLDLSATAITDRGLEILRQLPALRTLKLQMTCVTDVGLVNLAHCHKLECVDLASTRSGDGALRALAGMHRLHEFSSGMAVTDAGIALLHELPVFKAWQGGEPRMALLSHRAGPNQLVLRGTFTDQGMRLLRGLDGLFALDLDDARLGISAAAMSALTSLPRLGWLSVDAKDDWMPCIAALPCLRFLAVQDTSAGDDGFLALSRSQSLEYLWGRRCHNLRTLGFMALANIPTLRGLSVSCLNVEDAGLGALPAFPALRELMPIDVPDAGYRHIGNCAGLEALILMYCRNTTDAATECINGLSRLSYYFNSYTTITDRTPHLLSTLDSLERITFDTCHELTNAGIAELASLSKLRELRVSGCRVSNEAVRAFRPEVAIHIGD